MADAQDHDCATSTDDERDLARPVQRVGADPGTTKPGGLPFGRLGAGTGDQCERNSDEEQTSHI